MLCSNSKKNNENESFSLKLPLNINLHCIIKNCSISCLHGKYAPITYVCFFQCLLNHLKVFNAIATVSFRRFFAIPRKQDRLLTEEHYKFYIHA